MKIASNLILPDEAVTWKMGLLGRTGTGKTNTAIVIAEHMADHGFPFVIFDPQGDWWGLGSKYPIAILGGDHAHVPLEPTGGTIAADFVIAERVPVLLDLFTMGEGEMVRFATDFARRLWTRNRDALHVFLDEADLFAPQSGITKDKARCLGAWQNLVRRGRSRGIGCTMITQRSAVINKDLLTQADPLIVHRLTAPQDLAAIDFYLSYHGQSRAEIKAITAQIAKLRIGEAFVISPGTLEIEPRKVSVYKRKSFDSSATPEPGQKRREPRTMADVDLGALQTAMADTIERAKADDPRELRKQITELKRQLASKAPVVDQAVIDRVVAKVAGDRDAYWQALIAERDRKLAELCQRSDKIKALCDLNGQLDLTKPKPPKIGSPGSVRQAVATQVKPRVAKDLPARPDSSKTDGQPLPRGERAILTVCAQYPDGAERDQITIMTGYKRATRDAYLQRLREKGLIDTPRGEPVVATQDGLDALGDSYKVLPTGQALIEHWLDRLPVGECAIFSSVVDAYPSAVDRRSISDATGYKRATRDAYIQRLKSRRLITIESDGVKAADVFFEGAGV